MDKRTNCRMLVRNEILNRRHIMEGFLKMKVPSGASPGYGAEWVWCSPVTPPSPFSIGGVMLKVESVPIVSIKVSKGDIVRAVSMNMPSHFEFMETVERNARNYCLVLGGEDTSSKFEDFVEALEGHDIFVASINPRALAASVPLRVDHETLRDIVEIACEGTGFRCRPTIRN